MNNQNASGENLLQRQVPSVQNIQDRRNPTCVWGKNVPKKMKTLLQKGSCENAKTKGTCGTDWSLSLLSPFRATDTWGGGLVRFEGESDTGVCSDGARHMGSTVYSGLWVKGGREASAPPRPPPPSRDAALRPASLRAPAVWGLGFSFFRGQVWVEGSGLGCKGSGFRD